MDAATLLTNSLSADASVRHEAEQQLEHAARESYPQYMALLAGQMVSEISEANVRVAAGLAVKNALTARDPTRLLEYTQRWRSLAPEVKLDVKAKSLQTLTTPLTPVATAAGQVVAAIAAIDIPINQWSDLLDQLLAASSNTQNPKLRQAALQTIGFVCETMQHGSALEGSSGQILTAVIQGATKDEPDPGVQLAALHALSNSLEFVDKHFENEMERNYVMQVVCEDTQHARTDIKVAAFEVLNKIVPLYYDKMRVYMEQALFGITLQGMNDPEDEVKLQAIEFWSTVCEFEFELGIAHDTAIEDGEEPPDQISFQYAQLTCAQVLPSLLELLKTQEADTDEDEWNVAKAAGVCLDLYASTAQDLIPPLTAAFIETNIQSFDWHGREAAMMAFGSILSGPSVEGLETMVLSALPVVLDTIHDLSVEVRDTSAWVLGRLTDLQLRTIQKDSQSFDKLLTVVLLNATEQPRISAHCSWALMNLLDQLLDPEEETSVLSSHSFDGIIKVLLCASNLETNASSARTNAYEALAMAASQAPKDCLRYVNNLLVSIMERQEKLNRMVPQLVGVDARINWIEVQSNLCSVTTNVARRLGREMVPVADQLMTNLLTVIHVGNSAPGMSTVLEDAFTAVGSLVSAVESNFGKYIQAFQPFMLMALKAHEEAHLCGIAVGLIGDLCRALGKASSTYVDAWIEILFENLSSATLSREIKPLILSCFGDIALALGSHFDPYLLPTMTVLAQATQIQPNTVDFEMVSYVTTLREGICDSYTGIVSGLRADDQLNQLARYVESILVFIAMVHSMDPELRSELLVSGTLGLLGDLANAFPQGQLAPALTQGWVSELIRSGRSKANLKATRGVATWARTQVAKAVSAN